MNNKFIYVFIFLCITGCAATKHKDPCQIDCVTPYGTVLGNSGGVEAFSNCQAECPSFEINRVDGIYTGVKWQCVEYARRWLLFHQGAVYGDVDNAADIWAKVDHLTHVASGKQIKLETHLNGSRQPPQPGDLLLYARSFNNTGHVAIVTDIDFDSNMIELGEQNYTNLPWPNAHARKIEFVKRGENYWLLDGFLLGWKHMVD